MRQKLDDLCYRKRKKNRQLTSNLTLILLICIIIHFPLVKNSKENVTSSNSQKNKYTAIYFSQSRWPLHLAEEAPSFASNLSFLFSLGTVQTFPQIGSRLCCHVHIKRFCREGTSKEGKENKEGGCKHNVRSAQFYDTFCIVASIKLHKKFAFKPKKILLLPTLSFVFSTIIQQIPAMFNMLFNLENINFPSCSGGSISLLHSFTGSLLHFLLDIWNTGGSSQYKKALNARGKI